MDNALAHIIDDDEAIRDALSWLLQSRAIAVTTYDSAEDFLARRPAHPEGCVVLDIRMSGMSGLNLFEALLQQGCTLPVIFLTGHADVPMAVQALKRGAFDFFEKPFNDNELVDRVIAAMQQDIQRRAASNQADQLQRQLDSLSSRERQVMEKVLAGKLNKVIADELQISMRTVEVHRANLFDKMGVKTAVELAQKLVGVKEDGMF